MCADLSYLLANEIREEFKFGIFRLRLPDIIPFRWDVVYFVRTRSSSVVCAQKVATKLKLFYYLMKFCCLWEFRYPIIYVNIFILRVLTDCRGISDADFRIPLTSCCE